jgi:hypothetical protein
MKNQLILLVFLIALPQFLPAQNAKKAPFTLGETVEIHSGILSENRILNIYPPAGYSSDSTKTYPVIYLLDGSADEDFIHIAGLVQFGTFPWVNLLPESIVVGIANADRRRDFTFPTKNQQDKKDNPTSGGSENFIRFMEKELQPFVAAQYKTNGQKTLIGQSLGGLLATEILFKKPDLFNNYIIVSPSLWWDDESLLKGKPQFSASKIAVYLTVGADEHEVMVRTGKALSEQLKALPDHVRLFFKIFEGQNHGNILHLAVYDAFDQLFKPGQ